MSEEKKSPPQGSQNESGVLELLRDLWPKLATYQEVYVDDKELYSLRKRINKLIVELTVESFESLFNSTTELSSDMFWKNLASERYQTMVEAQKKAADLESELKSTNALFVKHSREYQDRIKELETKLAESSSTNSNIEQAKAEVDQWPDWKVNNMRGYFSEPSPVIPQQNSVIDLLHSTVQEQKERIAELEADLKKCMADWESATTQNYRDKGRINELETTNAKLKESYPTVWAYEQVCKSLATSKERIGELEAELKEERHLSEVRLYAAMGKESAEDRIKDLESQVQKYREALEFYANGAERIVEVNGKKHFVREFGCGCCTFSYDVDPDGTQGAMNCELDDIQGMMAREALKRQPAAPVEDHK